ncbi:hypothetical protein M9H77_31647 [Catharanthus roseus]|uniref:Uncharacterized protein n=1 Tax=Catharanthus roseus TaxID=4058 RepID=A0ACC0A0M0_CATRO|nr:hypothetical protein M9H77_31647 [Catharanthus roseus]
MSGGPGWQQPNLFFFLFFCYCLFFVNSSIAAAVILVHFWHPNISIPLFYIETGCPVLWIEEELVVHFLDTSSNFEGPFLKVVIRFHHLPKGDLIFLVSGVCYIPPSTQTSSEPPSFMCIPFPIYL